MVHLPVNSFSPPSPDWGQRGRNALGPACPAAPFKARGAQQDPGDRRAGAEHLEALLPLSSGLSWPGASRVARTGYVPGLQNTQLAATSSLRGLLLAPSLLDLHASCLPGAAGSRALPTHPSAQRGAAVPLRGSAQAAALPCVPRLCPRGFTQPWGSFISSAGAGGSTSLAHCSGVQAGVLCRGVALPCCVPACDSCPFPAAQVPDSVRAPGFSGPVPMAAVKQTVGLSPTAKSINLQTV